MFWKNKTQTSLNFFGGKNAEPGELYLFFFLSDVIGRSFFVCFFSFFLDRERSISCKKNREAIDVMDSF